MLGIEGRREGKWEKGEGEEAEDEGLRSIMGMVETVIMDFDEISVG